MGLLVCAGAILQCSFGQSPMPLMVIPQSGVINIMPAANITDNKPIINIPSFIMCNSMANPTVGRRNSVCFGRSYTYAVYACNIISLVSGKQYCVDRRTAGAQ